MNNTITRDLYWKKRIVAGVLFLVVLISTLCPTIAYAAETETRTVRVSYFEFPGYHDVIEGMALISCSFFEDTPI